MESRDVIDAPLQDYPNRSIWTTWAISFEAIRQKHKVTANLLLLWSFLDNKDLWYGMLEKMCEKSKEAEESEESGESEVAARMLWEWIGDIATSELEFNRAMQLLRNYSLIEEVEKTASYSTHPVVHQWAYHYQGKHLAFTLGRLVVVTVGWALPNPWNRDYSNMHRRLFLHAQACSAWVMKSQTKQGFGDGCQDKENPHTDEENKTVLDAIRYLAWIFKDHGMLIKAEQMYNQALQGNQAIFGAEHLSTLRALNDLGLLYQQQDKQAEAEQIFRRVLKGFEDALGPKHAVTLSVVNNLSTACIGQSKLAEGKRMIKRVLREREETLGPNHFWTRLAGHNLAMVYRRQLKLDKAEQMLKPMLQGSKEALGSDHEDTLRMMNELGLLYTAQGDLTGAEQLLNQALQGYEKIFGNSDLRTLATIHALGHVYYDQGDVIRAEQMLKQAGEGYEKIFDSDNPKTLAVFYGLGFLYYGQGYLTKAEQMYQRALQACENLVDEVTFVGERAKLVILEDLGRVYESQGLRDKACVMYSSVLSGIDKIPDPVEISDFSTYLSYDMNDRQRLTEAIKNLQKPSGTSGTEEDSPEQPAGPEPSTNRASKEKKKWKLVLSKIMCQG